MASHAPPSPRFQSPSARFAARGTETTFDSLSWRESHEPLEDPDPQMKCSSCGVWVHMLDLGNHVCAPPPIPAAPSLHDLRAGRGKLDDLRVNIHAAASGPGRAYGASLAARSPMYPDHLNPTPPLTPSSRPSSPSGLVAGQELSRSVSSVSSASSTGSSKLPFFEKYSKLVNNNTANASSAASNGGLPRSATFDNLAGQARPTPRAIPSPPFALSSSSSPSTQYAPPTPQPPFRPLAYSREPSSESIHRAAYERSRVLSNAASGSSIDRRPSPQPSQGSFRSDSDVDGANQPRQERCRNGTPASSILSSSPPHRSRKISMGERALRESTDTILQYTDSDVSGGERATIRASQSTPVKLSSYASSPATSPSTSRNGGGEPLFHQPPPKTPPPHHRSTSVGGINGAGGLNACLEDLRLMTEGEEDDGGAAVLDEFFGSGRFSDDLSLDLQATPRAPSHPSVPYSRSSPALAATVPAPVAPLAVSRKCTTCRRTVLSDEVQKAGDGQVFCRPCYAKRFLPKCRKCKLAIEGSAVTSSDGKVVGKYHPACFACFTCSEPFPDREFYVFEHRPYCQLHYHTLNGSLCTDPSCGKPIEGPCVSLVGEENGGGGRYHVDCFKCSSPTCGVPLMEHHFVVDRLPYCERHADGPEQRRPRQQAQGAEARARKRQTIITRR